MDANLNFSSRLDEIDAKLNTVLKLLSSLTGDRTPPPRPAPSTESMWDNPPPRQEQEMKKVDQAWFTSLVHTLLRHPSLGEHPKFKDALEDFGKLVHKDGELSTKRWKFFCVIHKQLTGGWPKEPKAGAGLKEKPTPADVRAGAQAAAEASLLKDLGGPEIPF